ncbi:MAG: hypothetical protein ACRC77_04220 [Bacteroidales bacterium]
MSGFIPLSREFLNGSLWNNFALIEKGLMIELLRITPMREKEYNLYGTPVKLDAYELCFSVKRMADFLGVTYHCLRMFLQKLEAMKLIRKKTRRFASCKPQAEARAITQTKRKAPSTNAYTSITFCVSVFVDIWGIDEVVSGNVEKNERLHNSNREHNLNNNIYTEGEEEIEENDKALKSENPKILLEEWRTNPVINSDNWQEEVAQYAAVDKVRLGDLLSQFVLQQQCQGNYFLMQREFQRRFVRFLETKIIKHKNKSAKTYGKETTTTTTVSECNNRKISEQTRRIDHLAAELFGTGGSGTGGDDA